MSVSHKSNNTQIYRLMVYNRALHPELFKVRARRMFKHADYEVEAWVTAGGHMVRYQFNAASLTETVVEDGDHLPEVGLIHALPCMGEKEFELSSEEGVSYVTTVQTESLIDNLYMATLREMRDYAIESNSIFHEWNNDEGVLCLSMIDLQTFKDEFHIQSYHLLGNSGIVLRTQSIFENIN